VPGLPPTFERQLMPRRLRRWMSRVMRWRSCSLFLSYRWS
jgi:hypothetical protein